MLSLLNTTFTNAVRGGASLASKILSKLTSRADVIESEDCVKEALRGSTARNASFALIPSAYSDGVVHAALPDDGSGDLDFSRVNPAGGTRINSQGAIEKVNLLGDELVANGAFVTTLSDDVFNPNQFFGNTNSVTDGVYEIDITSSNLFGFQRTSLLFEPGTRYRIDWEVIETTVASGNFAVWNGAGSATYFGDLTQAGNTGTIYKDGIISASNGDVRGNNLSNGTIKFRLTVKEVIEGYVSDTELVTNGGFDDGLNGWQVLDGASGIDITLDNGQARFITDGAGGGIQQNGFLEVGKTYQMEFDYTAIEGGIKIVPYFLDISETKRYSGIFKATSTLFSFYRNNTYGDTEGLIDNISVKEVVQDNWVVGTGWSIEDDGNGNNVASADVVYGSGNINQPNLLTAGKTYKCEYEIKNYVSGNVVSLMGGQNQDDKGTPRSSNGVFTDIRVATSSTFYFRGDHDFQGSIDNISVKEVIEEGIPRLNYDDIEYQDVLGAELITNGEFEGEIQSTNWIPDSNSYTGNIIYYTQTPNQSSPDGLNNATLFTEKTDTGFHSVNSLSAVATGGQTYTYSFFIKYNGVQYVTVNATDGVLGFIADLDILNGTVVAGAAQATTRIEEYEDGWWRVSIVRTISSTASAAQISFNFGVITGDGVSGFYLFGYQIEKQKFVTGYIPTSGVPESRPDTTQWTSLNANIQGGVVKLGHEDGSISQIIKSNIFTSGKKYLFEYEVLEDNGGYFGLVGTSISSSLDTTVGVHKVEFYANGVSFYMKRASSLTRTITTFDNISIKEITGQEVASSGCPSLLVEPQSTNLIPYSEDFSHSSWTKSYGAAIESNSINFPEGVLNATKFKSNITGAAFSELRNDTQSGKTLSIFAKSGEVKQIMIFAVGSITQGIYFNLDDGSFSSYYSLSTKISNYSSESFGDGWYRYEITFTEVFGSFKLFLAENDSITFSLTLGHGIYIYGAQLEALPYATSYIPTSGVIATRSAETLEKTNISHLINSEEGVFYVEMKVLHGVGNYKVIEFNDNSNQSKRIALGFRGDKAIFYYNDGGSLLTSYSTNVFDYNKFAFKYDSQEVKFFLNGVLMRTETKQLDIDFNKVESERLQSEAFYGSIKDLRIYKSIAEAQKDLTYIN